jgi:hypothetical protein
VLPEPIKFFPCIKIEPTTGIPYTGFSWDTSWPPLIPHRRNGLCSKLLRTSKSVHREASPLLYSGNDFELTNLQPISSSLSSKSAVLASFFSQIGRQNASFLRHICVDFPLFYYCRFDLQDSVTMLELIRDNCTGITKLETTLRYMTHGSRILAELLEFLDTRLKAISSFKEVIVQIYCSEDPSDDMKQAMRDCGWVTKITILEELEDEYDGEEDADVINFEIEAEWEEEFEYYRDNWLRSLNMQELGP